MLDVALELAAADELGGICRTCGTVHYGVEPDAVGYRCEECDALDVYGAELLLVMYA